MLRTSTLLLTAAALGLAGCQPRPEGAASQPGGEASGEVAAEVNGVAITTGELDAWIKEDLFRARAENPSALFQLRQAGLRQMIENQVVEQEAKKRGVSEDVLLVCPALNSKLRTWTSDEDGARAQAQARLDTSLSRLAELGVRARGEIGDGDPLQALEDALREFPADEIVVSTHPPGRSHWLELGVVENARMLGVVYEGPQTVYHIRMVGGADTIEHHKKGFDEWLQGFK